MAQPSTGGRERQRRRTRRAIVNAAAELLARGESPSVTEIAEAAEVSRRTVYLYFPTLDQLLADAALAATGDFIEPALTTSAAPQQRLDNFVRGMQRGAADTEQLGRTVIRLTLDPVPDGAAEPVPRRGYRRVEWIERALEPVAAQLDADRFERLVSALTLVVGWEPFMTLRDTRGLSGPQIEDVSAWIARTLLAATLAESESSAAGESSAAEERSAAGEQPG